MPDEALRSHDGVGLCMRGDLLLVYYGADARLHRTRWLFDRADELIARTPGGILSLMIVAPGAAPPDGATREENARRFATVRPNLRRMVTVPLGDSLQTSIVRTVMRALALLQRQADVHKIASTEEEGVSLILERRSVATPTPMQIHADLQTLHRGRAAA